MNIIFSHFIERFKIHYIFLVLNEYVICIVKNIHFLKQSLNMYSKNIRDLQSSFFSSSIVDIPQIK